MPSPGRTLPLAVVGLLAVLVAGLLILGRSTPDRPSNAAPAGVDPRADIASSGADRAEGGPRTAGRPDEERPGSTDPSPDEEPPRGMPGDGPPSDSPAPEERFPNGLPIDLPADWPAAARATARKLLQPVDLRYDDASRADIARALAAALDFPIHFDPRTTDGLAAPATMRASGISGLQASILVLSDYTLALADDGSLTVLPASEAPAPPVDPANPKATPLRLDARLQLLRTRTPPWMPPARLANVPDDPAPSPRAYLGIAIEDSGEGEEGVRVRQVVEGSPAAAAGIAAGDLIVAVNGETTATGGDFMRVVQTLRPGLRAMLDVRRADARLYLVLDLGTR